MNATDPGILHIVEQHPAVIRAAVHTSPMAINVAVRVIPEADPDDIVNELANILSGVIVMGVGFKVQARHELCQKLSS